MKRNSIFNSIPLLKPKRNTFNLSFENKLSTDLFRLTPIMVKEALPDDVVKIRPEIFCRVSPMLSPIFHRLNIRTYYFFVPTRIIWDDFEKWINPKSGVSDIVAPRLQVDNEGMSVAPILFGPKTLADYLGVNFGLNAEDQSNVVTMGAKMADLFPDGFQISSLPFRAYQQIYNDWFIDLNNVDVAEFSKESGVEEILGGDEETDSNVSDNLLAIRYRAWEHDYFTSALPEPQRGPDVNAFDGASGEGEGGELSATISGEGTIQSPITRIGEYQYKTASNGGGNQFVLKVGGNSDITPAAAVVANYGAFGFANQAAAEAFVASHNIKLVQAQASGNAFSNTSGWYIDADGDLAGTNFVPHDIKYLNDTASANLGVWQTFEGRAGDNLGRTDVSASAVADALSVTISGSGGGSVDIPAVTVEELRIRMQMQSFLERNEVGGSRYTEMLYAHWGVKDPDGRLQRSEFIGGCKQPIVINDISQTVNTDDEPLGMYGGQGTSSSTGRTIRYRVPEHGFIIGITCIVPRSGYSQGINKMWFRFDRLDYYWPSFAHLGEQEVLNKELMFTGFDPDEVFGYQQRYAEYKSSNDEVHGDMKGVLAHWHMSRLFDTPESADDLPKLSANFTTPKDSDGDALSRVWPVASGGFESLNADHFVLDIYQHFYASRRMPKYATPRNGM